MRNEKKEETDEKDEKVIENQAENLHGIEINPSLDSDISIYEKSISSDDEERSNRSVTQSESMSKISENGSLLEINPSEFDDIIEINLREHENENEVHYANQINQLNNVLLLFALLLVLNNSFFISYINYKFYQTEDIGFRIGNYTEKYLKGIENLLVTTRAICYYFTMYIF